MANPSLLASVLVAVKGDSRVRRLLGRLLEQTVPASEYEIIVVENGTSQLSDVDGMRGVVRYLHHPEANSAVARNMGLATARGRYLLLTDADCVPAPDWVERLTTHLARGTAAGVGGPVSPFFAPSTARRLHQP